MHNTYAQVTTVTNMHQSQPLLHLLFKAPQTSDLAIMWFGVVLPGGMILPPGPTCLPQSSKWGASGAVCDRQGVCSQRALLQCYSWFFTRWPCVWGVWEPARSAGVDFVPGLYYFDDNYISRIRLNQRGNPKFDHALWNMYDCTSEKLPRTNNNVEGWHRKMLSALTSYHPTCGVS